jgi:hypothetical protein
MLFGMKRKPRLAVCRDGGSITAEYSDFFGKEYVITLPVKWEGSREEMQVVGYKSAFLEKLVNTKKYSKGNGKPYKVTSFEKVEITNSQALKVAKKILNDCEDAERDLAIKLLRGIESGK